MENNPLDTREMRDQIHELNRNAQTKLDLFDKWLGDLLDITDLKPSDHETF